jgi:acetyl esterase/lipase
MIAAYLPNDLKIPFFTQPYEKIMGGFLVFPADTIPRRIASLNEGDMVSSASPPERLEIAFSATPQGKYLELLGAGPSLFPMERLNRVKDIPPIFIIHRKDDSAVPYKSSVLFVEKMKKTHPEVKVLLYRAVDGCEHGLDGKVGLGETSWLKEGLDFVTPLWLGEE